jgi:small ligand-binding sensory domain FIST
MTVQVAVGVSESFDPLEAFSEAAAEAARGLEGPCDLCAIFAAAPHLGHAKWILSEVHERLEPRNLIGCGASGVVGGGREIEDGPGAVVWAASLPGAELVTHHLRGRPGSEEPVIMGIPEQGLGGEFVILLADPSSFPTEALLGRIQERRPGLPVLGGLVSASGPGGGVFFRDGEVLAGGAVAASISGVPVIPCVSQGAAPVGPEMTITAARENVIEELASAPALERLRSALAELLPRERELASEGVMLGIVIDENKPEYERGDFLIRGLLGADPSSGALAVGDTLRVGQTVRFHVRDAQSADEDLQHALRLQAAALAGRRTAGALLFTCNGRGRHMFAVADHDAGALASSFGAPPVSGFFCAGEIGPVGGRNFLHGFTATIALFPG